MAAPSAPYSSVRPAGRELGSWPAFGPDVRHVNMGAMRKGTTITLAVLLLAILGAAAYQLFFLAR